MGSQGKAAGAVNHWGAALLPVLVSEGGVAHAIELWLGAAPHPLWDTEGPPLAAPGDGVELLDRFFVSKVIHDKPPFIQAGRVLAGKDARFLALVAAAVIGSVSALSPERPVPAPSVEAFLVSFDVVHAHMSKIMLRQRQRIEKVDARRREGRITQATKARQIRHDVLADRVDPIHDSIAISRHNIDRYYTIFEQVVDEVFGMQRFQHGLVFKNVMPSMLYTLPLEQLQGASLGLQVKKPRFPIRQRIPESNDLYSRPADEQVGGLYGRKFRDIFTESSNEELLSVERCLNATRVPVSNHAFIADTQAIHNRLFRRLLTDAGEDGPCIRVLIRALSRLRLCVRAMTASEFGTFYREYSSIVGIGQELWLPDRCMLTPAAEGLQ